MALNLKALLPVTDHPPVTHPVMPDRARAGADKEKGLEEELSSRRRGIIAWKMSMKDLPKAKKLQLLDVL